MAWLELAKIVLQNAMFLCNLPLTKVIARRLQGVSIGLLYAAILSAACSDSGQATVMATECMQVAETCVTLRVTLKVFAILQKVQLNSWHEQKHCIASCRVEILH